MLKVRSKLKVGSKFKVGNELSLIAEVTRIDGEWIYYKMIDEISLKFYAATAFKNEGLFMIGSKKYEEAVAAPARTTTG